MKQFLTALLISFTSLYLIVAFIGLTPNIVEWEVGGRAAFVLFGLLFGVMGYIIHNESDKPDNKPNDYHTINKDGVKYWAPK